MLLAPAEKTTMGIVSMDVEEGQRVLYAKYAGTEIKVDGKKLLILKETDVLAIVEE